LWPDALTNVASRLGRLADRFADCVLLAVGLVDAVAAGARRVAARGRRRACSRTIFLPPVLFNSSR